MPVYPRSKSLGMSRPCYASSRARQQAKSSHCHYQVINKVPNPQKEPQAEVTIRRANREEMQRLGLHHSKILAGENPHLVEAIDGKKYELFVSSAGKVIYKVSDETKSGKATLLMKDIPLESAQKFDTSGWSKLDGSHSNALKEFLSEEAQEMKLAKDSFGQMTSLVLAIHGHAKSRSLALSKKVQGVIAHGKEQQAKKEQQQAEKTYEQLTDLSLGAFDYVSSYVSDLSDKAQEFIALGKERRAAEKTYEQLKDFSIGAFDYVSSCALDLGDSVQDLIAHGEEQQRVVEERQEAEKTFEQLTDLSTAAYDYVSSHVSEWGNDIQGLIVLGQEQRAAQQVEQQRSPSTKGIKVVQEPTELDLLKQELSEIKTSLVNYERMVHLFASSVASKSPQEERAIQALVLAPEDTPHLAIDVVNPEHGYATQARLHVNFAMALTDKAQIIDTLRAAKSVMCGASSYAESLDKSSAEKNAYVENVFYESQYEELGGLIETVEELIQRYEDKPQVIPREPVPAKPQGADPFDDNYKSDNFDPFA